MCIRRARPKRCIGNQPLPLPAPVPVPVPAPVSALSADKAQSSARPYRAPLARPANADTAARKQGQSPRRPRDNQSRRARPSDQKSRTCPRPVGRRSDATTQHPKSSSMQTSSPAPHAGSQTRTPAQTPQNKNTPQRKTCAEPAQAKGASSPTSTLTASAPQLANSTTPHATSRAPRQLFERPQIPAWDRAPGLPIGNGLGADLAGLGNLGDPAAKGENFGCSFHAP